MGITGRRGEWTDYAKVAHLYELGDGVFGGGGDLGVTGLGGNSSRSTRIAYFCQGAGRGMPPVSDHHNSRLQS